jgi:hypothetical protein
LKIILIGLLSSLLLVFFQDWKYRRIHVILPLIIFVLSCFILRANQTEFINNCVLNLVFFLFTLCLLTIYMSVKNKRFLNPFQNYFGLGDLLFYLAITPLFILKNYIIYFVFSMIFSICLQIGLKKIIKEDTVPLAGFAALLLFIIIIKDSFLIFQKITLI